MGPVERLIADPLSALIAFGAIWALSMLIKGWDRVSLSNRQSRRHR